MTGGYLIPETVEIDVERPGWFYAGVRSIGQRIINIGASIRRLGYSSKIIHPRQSLLARMKDKS